MHENEFEPKVGRMRASGSPRGRRYLLQVIAAVQLAGGRPRSSRKQFSGNRIGRGAAIARLLRSRNKAGGARGRRAIVKARLVRLGSTGAGAARAHLRYVQRDAGREDGTGRLYAAGEDVADGRAFLDRCEGDRHQFRFIVSAEDGAQYEDLRPLIRRMMMRMEEDLGTRLDWVAADHLDTAHPHSHIILRGKDDRGENLVIARDYLARGMRERVGEIVTLDLGPRTDLEIEQRLRQEVGAERLTSIDRRLLRDMDEAREVGATGRTMLDQALRAGRLQKLARLGLATATGEGRWRLAGDLEPALRALGERGDIVRTMQRALTARRVERAPIDQVVKLAGLGGRVLVGRLVERGLSDEARDRHYLIIDGIDGRAHYVDAGRADAVEPLPPGAIVRISGRVPGAREVDRTIVAVAGANDGIYSEARHREHDVNASREFVSAHARRLEAMRRLIGRPERESDGSWRIGTDHLERAAAFEAHWANDAPVRVELLSPLRLEALATAPGATWLDRQLVGERSETLREAGFGAEVRSARAARQRWLVEQGLAEEADGAVRFRRNLLAVLRQRELVAVAAQHAEDGSPARFGEAGEKVSGVLQRRLDLASGRYGAVQSAGELVLVPWRPDLERQLGRELTGQIGPGGLSWSRGRGRGLDIG